MKKLFQDAIGRNRQVLKRCKNILNWQVNGYSELNLHLPLDLSLRLDERISLSGKDQLTYFVPLVSFYNLWKYKKSLSFQCFQGLQQETSGKKWVNKAMPTEIALWWYFIERLKWANISSNSYESLSVMVNLKNVCF